MLVTFSEGNKNVRNFAARLFLSASVLLVLGSGIAAAGTKTIPSPKPTLAPVSGIKTSGTLREFYFTRTNFNGIGATKAPPPNAASFQIGGKFHAEYNLPHSPWTLGATYYGAALNAQDTVNLSGTNPAIDNTLPGYRLSLLGESYVQYKNAWINGQIGKEQINTPWANPSDSRIVPALFQGVTVSGKVSPALTVGAMYMARFRARVTSAFNSNTLLTSCNTTKGVPGDPCNAQQTTRGFLLLSANAKLGPQLTANLYQYQVYDLVGITHLDAQYAVAPKTFLKPTLAAQYVAENNLGNALIGTINNRTIGLQVGGALAKTVSVALSYNTSPVVTYQTTKALCGSVPGGIFGGVVGAPVAGSATLFNCYGGGIASPYTDSYATDPLYTTSISQGLADTHKAGQGSKIALTFNPNAHVKLVLSEARYNYSNDFVGDFRSEGNADLTVLLGGVDPKKTYKGFSFRQRFALRTAQFPTIAPGRFWYNRTQFEYTF